MSLTPIGQNNKYSATFRSSKNNVSNLKTNTVANAYHLDKDIYDDGKISAKKSLKHFFNGIISPIKMLVSSPKNMIIGAGAIVSSALLCAAFPPLLPVMVATGVATGSIQLLSGGYKALTAKTDKEAEQAWESIGSGTFSVGTSALGAKTSLKAAGIDKVDDLSFINATIKCFKEIPASISKSVKMAKNGTFLTSLRNTVLKPINYADVDDLAKLKEAGYDADKLAEIKKYSEILHNEGMNSVYPDANSGKMSSIQEVIDILPEGLKDKVKVRVKSPSSIKDKLINKLTSDKKAIKIDNIDDARNQIGDLIGTCIALDNPDEAQMAILIDHFGDALREGKINFLEIDNYRGSGITPYFSSDNIDALREAARSNNADINPFEGFGIWDSSDKIKPSGYTTAQINIKYKDGSLGEFQVRGKGVQKLANVEHIPYDLRQSKDLSAGNFLLRKLYKPLENYVKLLSNDGYSEYNSYLNALYRYYRKIEVGTPNLQKPKITDFIKSSPSEVISKDAKLSPTEMKKAYDTILKMLDIDNIETLHQDAGWLKTIPRSTRKKVIVQNLTTYLAAEPYITKENINN